MSDRWAMALSGLAILSALGPVRARGAPSDLEPIKTEYRRIHDELNRYPRPSGPATPEVTAQLDRVWPLVGAWLAVHLQAQADAGSDDVARWVSDLNPAPTPTSIPTAVSEEAGIDEGDPMARYLEASSSYDLSAVALQLDDGPVPLYAVAVTYGIDGRLLVVSPNGTPTSAEIERGGVLYRLPEGRDGKRRFYVNARSDDWSTSACRGGQLSVWEWDGGRATQALVGEYSDMGPGAGWGVHVRGTAMRVYTHGGLHTFGECCGCTSLKAVWKIRLGPRRIEDHGLRYYTRELQVADELLYRVLRGEDVSDIATFDVGRTLAEILRTECRTADTYYLSPLRRWALDSAGALRTLDLELDNLQLTFTLTRREDGRFYVVAVRGPDPAIGRLQAAMQSWLVDYRLDSSLLENRRRAADAVLDQRPDLALGEEEVEQAIARACEGQPWPWR